VCLMGGMEDWCQGRVEAAVTLKVGLVSCMQGDRAAWAMGRSGMAKGLCLVHGGEGGIGAQMTARQPPGGAQPSCASCARSNVCTGPTAAHHHF